MCEYTIEGEYKCSKQLSHSSLPSQQSVKEHFTNIINIPTYHSPNISIPTLPHSQPIKIDSYCSYDKDGGITVCPAGQCCNPNGKCGGTITYQENQYCIEPSGMGILNGLFDNGGRFKGQPDLIKNPNIKNNYVHTHINKTNITDRCGQDSDGNINMCPKNYTCYPDGKCLMGNKSLLSRFENHY